MEFPIMGDIFFISPQTGNLLSKQISITKSAYQLYFFVCRVKHFWNKLPNQDKNSNSKKKRKTEKTFREWIGKII